MQISAVLVTFNEEKRIESALKSLEGLAAEIVVVDSHSTDETVRIARKYTTNVLERTWTGPAEQKNYANSAASLPWVLALDADERVSPELRGEIMAMAEVPAECAAFSIPRRAFYLDRWIRHSGWSPDRRVRLFRHDRARWEGDFVSDRLLVDGTVRPLRGPIHHFPFVNISEHAIHANKSSELAAQQLYARKAKSRLVGLFVSPPASFLKTYFLKLGVLDGFPGLVIALMNGYSAFLRQAKLREIWTKGERIEPFPY